MKNFLVMLYPPGYRVRKHLLIMKLSFLFSLIFALQVSAVGYGQQTKLTLSKQSTSLSEIIELIQNETDYSFLFANDEIMAVDNISVEVKDADIHVIMGECLKNTDLIFEVEDNVVIIRKKMPEKTVPPAKQTQRKAVKGIVYDDKDVALPGATVLLKSERARGTITDLDGRFELVISEKSILRITFIGMQDQEIEVEPGKEYKVFMKPEIGELAQVVVTGYFNKSKESFTGAATKVTAADLERVNSVNVLTALSQVDPSFHLVENNLAGSDPNSLPDFTIRGNSSFPDLTDDYKAHPNMPTFILDGFEVGVEKIYDMDPSRVESMTILKDASATAIYGSRASNGVVVIKTKAPRKGKIRVEYTGNYNLDMPDLSDYDLLNASEKLQLEVESGYFEAEESIGFPVSQNEARKEIYNKKLQAVEKGYDTYWISQPVETAFTQKHSLALSGGSEKFRYGLNMRYDDGEGVMKKSGRDRYGIGLKLHYIYKTITFRNEMSYDYNIATNSPYGKFHTYATLNPYYSMTDDYGRYLYQLEFIDNKPVYNPLFNSTLNSRDESSYYDFRNNFSVNWHITDAAKLKGGISVRQKNTYTEKFLPAQHTSFGHFEKPKFNEKGSYDSSFGRTFSIDANVVFSYYKTLNNHLLSINTGGNVRTSNTNTQSFRALGFPSDDLNHPAFANFYPSGNPGGGDALSRMIGVFANFNYSYDNRYFADISGRADASSKFGADSRWAPFGSVGVGWNLHNESFMKDARVNELKVRASFGYTGSQAFHPYQAIWTYKYITDDRYLHNVGAVLKAYGNEQLKWQRSEEINLGLDFAAFDNRLTFSVDAYQKVSKSLLIDMSLAPSTGFSSYKENIGQLENRGIEIKSSVSLIKNKNFLWKASASLTHNRNKILKISEALRSHNDTKDEEVSRPAEKDEEVSGSSAKNNPYNRYVEGESLNAIWALHSLGIDPATGKEFFLTPDGKRTNKWNAAYIQPMGVKDADIQGTFNNMISYKGWQFNMLFLYRLGGQMYNSTLVQRVENASKRLNTDRRVLEDRWKKPGDISFFKDVKDDEITRPTSRFIQDYNFLELASANLSYRFKPGVIRKLGMEHLKIVVYANNLFRASSVKAERGIDYPFARSVTMKIQTTF